MADSTRGSVVPLPCVARRNAHSATGRGETRRGGRGELGKKRWAGWGVAGAGEGGADLPRVRGGGDGLILPGGAPHPPPFVNPRRAVIGGRIAPDGCDAGHGRAAAAGDVPTYVRLNNRRSDE